MTQLSKAARNALILAPVALFPFLIVGVLFVFRQSSQRRAVADPAIYTAQTSPQVAAMIGLPIEPGWPIHGQIVEKGGDGSADLTILLRGSRGQGTLAEVARREHGKWRICALRFHVDAQAALILVDPAQTHCE